MRLHRFIRKLYRIGWQCASARLPGKSRIAAACKYAAWSEGVGNGPKFGIELGLEPNVIYLLVMVWKARITYLWRHHRLFYPAAKEIMWLRQMQIALKPTLKKEVIPLFIPCQHNSIVQNQRWVKWPIAFLWSEEAINAENPHIVYHS